MNFWLPSTIGPVVNQLRPAKFHQSQPCQVREAAGGGWGHIQRALHQFPTKNVTYGNLFNYSRHLIYIYIQYIYLGVNHLRKIKK